MRIQWLYPKTKNWEPKTENRKPTTLPSLRIFLKNKPPHPHIDQRSCRPEFQKKISELGIWQMVAWLFLSWPQQKFWVALKASWWPTPILFMTKWFVEIRDGIPMNSTNTWKESNFKSRNSMDKKLAFTSCGAIIFGFSWEWHGSSKFTAHLLEWSQYFIRVFSDARRAPTIVQVNWSDIATFLLWVLERGTPRSW